MILSGPAALSFPSLLAIPWISMAVNFLVIVVGGTLRNSCSMWDGDRVFLK